MKKIHFLLSLLKQAMLLLGVFAMSNLHARLLQSIHTPRLIIRPLELRDVPDCLAILSDERVACMHAGLTLIHDISQAQEFVMAAQKQYETNHYEYLAVQEKATGKMIGMVGFDDYKPEFYRTALGYSFAYKYWGKGYATEASNALMDLAFMHMNINRFFATVDPENIRSIRVLEKLGMKLEGHLRQNRTLPD